MAQTFYSIHDVEIAHWGIKGQKWGLRRYQNPDGTLTEAGRIRYAKQQAKAEAKEQLRQEKEARRREKIIQSPLRMYKHRHEFTNEEIKDAASRFEVEEILLKHLDTRRKSALLMFQVEDKAVKQLDGIVDTFVPASVAKTPVSAVKNKAKVSKG